MNTIINPDLRPEEQAVSTRLREMKMSGMAEAFERQVLDPNADLSSFMERITELVNTEWQIRYDKKLNRLLRADLDDSIYEADRELDHASIEKLATCNWIDEGRNLLITGMTSSGKTYLSNALCVSALRKLKTVRYIKASHLMFELEQARMKDTYMNQLTLLSKVDLLAIDDFGLMELDITDRRHSYRIEMNGRSMREPV